MVDDHIIIMETVGANFFYIMTTFVQLLDQKGYNMN